MPNLPNLNDDPLADDIRRRANEPPKSGAKQPAEHRKPELPKRFLSVRVYRDYGAVSVEFGVSAECQPETLSDQARIWNDLNAQVLQQHDEWAQSVLPNIPHLDPPKPESKPAAQNNTKPGIKTIQYPVLSIKRDAKRSQFVVYTDPGTQYARFPVVVPDQLAALYRLPEQLTADGELTPMPEGVTVFVNDGRVVGFEGLS